MKNLILHQATRRQLEDFIKTPSHAVLLTGPRGSGKAMLAQTMAEAILELDNDLEDYPYKMIIAEEGSIGIEAVRGLEKFLSLKVPRPTAFNRVAIIEDAQSLTLEAQNALLKTLEEPPVGTFIILSVDYIQALLPTISSRAQTISVKRPIAADLTAYFAAEDPKQVKQAYAISGGLPGLMTALLNQAEHPLIQATEQARQWLRAPAYERLLMVDELSKQKQLALDMNFIIQQMAHVSLQTASGPAAKRWHGIMRASFVATEELNQSVQPKLALVNLALAV